MLAKVTLEFLSLVGVLYPLWANTTTKGAESLRP